MGATLFAWRALFHAIVIPGGPHPGADTTGWTLALRPLGRELAADTGAALILAFVLSFVAGPPRRRMVVAAALGLFAWFSQGFPLWNWHHVPAGFVLAEAVHQTIGWALAGFAMALVLRRAGTEADSRESGTPR